MTNPVLDKSSEKNQTLLSKVMAEGNDRFSIPGIGSVGDQAFVPFIKKIICSAIKVFRPPTTKGVPYFGFLTFWVYCYSLELN